MIKAKTLLKNLVLIMLLIGSSVGYAKECSHAVVDKIINSNTEPEGVVFELSEYDENAWDWASEMIESLSKQLKNKYPNIDIAIVSHGNEQFQLTRNNKEQNQHTISTLTNLVNSSNIDLHVCAVNSSWSNIPTDAYINIVDVAESGPAKVNDYINLGYRRIKLQKP